MAAAVLVVTLHVLKVFQCWPGFKRIEFQDGFRNFNDASFNQILTVKKKKEKPNTLEEFYMLSSLRISLEMKRIVWLKSGPRSRLRPGPGDIGPCSA